MRRVIFILFSPNEQRGGGGGGVRCQTSDFFFLFSFPFSANHERDWSTCKVVFSGLATKNNTLNVKNKQNNFQRFHPGRDHH